MTNNQFDAQKGISRITYAFLKDMGWYTVDGTFNDTSTFGYQKGCDFVNNICYSSTAYTEFCSVASNVNI
jgi:hypothetical protein